MTVNNLNESKLQGTPSPSENQKSDISNVIIDSLENESEKILKSYKNIDKICDFYVSDVTDREYHNGKSTYWLPKDECEKHRLTAQHFGIKELFGGNVLSNVHEVIDFNKGVSILDVGCGSGVWMMDMYSDYPNCTYEGCDIVDISHKDSSIKKINYSFGNVVEGLPYPDNTFDFVTIRLFILALRSEEWPIAIKELLRVTKPGGVVQFVEVELRMTGGEAFQKGARGMISTCIAKGQDPHIASRLDGLIEEVGGSKIIQSEYRFADLDENSSAFKILRWNHHEVVAAMMPVMGPLIGLENTEKQKDFLKSFKEDLKTSNGYTYFKGVATQKL